MILFQHSMFDADSIAKNLGMPEYSYWFVRKAFQGMLARIGDVRDVADPEREVDELAAAGRRGGDRSVLFSFNPPHYTPIGLQTPTIPVFAWEYDRIPDEAFSANPQEDWRVTLAATGLAVTHCSSSVAAIRRAMGDDYPAWVIPAPVHDRHRRHATTARGRHDPVEVSFEGGLVIDASAIDLAMFSPDRVQERGVRALRLLRRAFADADWRPQRLTVGGVVYTAVLNPDDGRKNWHDLTGAFVWAFRDRPDATLILKITYADMFGGVLPVLTHLSKLGRFRCRILLIHGLLTDAAYAAMVGVTSYAVNSSHGEGQCLPLMEFMSAGRPAVTPGHTAMADYAAPANAFLVESHEVVAAWPHDPRDAKRCMRHQASFADLVRAYRDSYAVAIGDPDRYARMSQAAVDALERFCGDAVVERRLREVVAHARDRDPREPLKGRQLGIRDLRLTGWSNEATNELAPGFPISADDVVIDVGCGDGGPVRFAGGRGAHVVLTDVDPERLAEAERRLASSPARRVEAHRVADGDPLPVPADYATRIVCNQVLEHVDDPDQVMAEMVRVGRPGALYLLAVPGMPHERVQRAVAPPQCFAKPHHIRSFEHDAFDAMIERHGLVIERRSEEGFFWAVWRACVWQSASDDIFGQGADPALDGWTAVWSDILDGPNGREIMAAFDAELPERRIVIARKPGAPRRASLFSRLFPRAATR